MKSKNWKEEIASEEIMYIIRKDGVKEYKEEHNLDDKKFKKKKAKAMEICIHW